MHAESDIERESHSGSWLVAGAAVALLPVLYVLSWGPIGALSERYSLLCTTLDVAYPPIGWVTETFPETYEPLTWYWRQFDFLRPNPDDRARQLIKTSESLDHIPQIWEKAWFLDMPDSATPYRTHSGVI